ncbi:hypothetical protein FH968_23205 [Buttiauxella sp. B2]|nr:hypothetical protein FH968_23205 [Buttiauxella sp. B2]
MKWLFLLIVVVCASIIGLFAAAFIFYLTIEIFFYFYGGIPISMNPDQLKKILKISVAGGSILGSGIVLLRIFRVKGF